MIIDPDMTRDRNQIPSQSTQNFIVTHFFRNQTLAREFVGMDRFERQVKDNIRMCAFSLFIKIHGKIAKRKDGIGHFRAQFGQFILEFVVFADVIDHKNDLRFKKLGRSTMGPEFSVILKKPTPAPSQ